MKSDDEVFVGTCDFTLTYNDEDKKSVRLSEKDIKSIDATMSGESTIAVTNRFTSVETDQSKMIEKNAADFIQQLKNLREIRNSLDCEHSKIWKEIM